MYRYYDHSFGVYNYKNKNDMVQDIIEFLLCSHIGNDINRYFCTDNFSGYYKISILKINNDTYKVYEFYVDQAEDYLPYHRNGIKSVVTIDELKELLDKIVR